MSQNKNLQMSLCMAYVFAAVVEYAVANFIKKPEIDRLARRVFPISFSLLRLHPGFKQTANKIDEFDFTQSICLFFRSKK